MAVIYKAQDLALGRIVAIKVLRPSLTGDPTFLERFRQEARNVANLAHPNIVTLYDVGQDGNTYYMVMEYIEGKDLKKLIRESAPFSVERALHIGIQICAGIGYAHRAGLVHADVKPQNVLVTEDDHVKVTDFGIAQALSKTQTQEKQSVVWGSPHYFAPEQASGEPPSPASDVYAIGIVLFEMLTGKLPYSGNDHQELALAHIREQVPHVMEYNPNVPVHLDRIIYKVMSKEPANRYRTADQLGRILISYQKQGSEVTANVPPSLAPDRTQQPVIPAPAPISPGAQPVQRATPFGTPPQRGGTPPTPTYTPQPQQSNVPNVSSAPAPIVIGNRAAPAANPYQPAQPQGANPANRNTPYGPAPTREQPGGTSGSRPAPDYNVTPPPPAIDVVSIILAIIALIAVAGLFPLWLWVLNTWFGH